MKLDNHDITFSLKSCNKKKTLKKNNSVLWYFDILENINISYEMQDNKIKENIVLKKRNKVLENIIFMIHTDLELSLEDGKKIKALEGEKLIFTIECPYMQDKLGKYCDNLSYELVKENQKYKLILHLDSEYLLNENTVYPVVIDPTVKVEEKVNVYDTYIYPGDNLVSRNDFDILKVGVEKVNNQDIVNRALLKFDLPVLGTGAQIQNATLNLVRYPYL